MGRLKNYLAFCRQNVQSFGDFCRQNAKFFLYDPYETTIESILRDIRNMGSESIPYCGYLAIWIRNRTHIPEISEYRIKSNLYSPNDVIQVRYRIKIPLLWVY